MDLVAYVARVAETDAPERVARALGGRGDPEIRDRAPVAAHMGARFSARACALQRRLVRQRLRDAGRSGRGEVHRPSHAARLPAGLDPHRDLPRRGHGGVRPDPRRQRGARRPQWSPLPLRLRQIPVARPCRGCAQDPRGDGRGGETMAQYPRRRPRDRRACRVGDPGRPKGGRRRDRVQLDAGDQRRRDQCGPQRPRAAHAAPSGSTSARSVSRDQIPTLETHVEDRPRGCSGSRAPTDWPWTLQTGGERPIRFPRVRGGAGRSISFGTRPAASGNRNGCSGHSPPCGVVASSDSSAQVLLRASVATMDFAGEAQRRPAHDEAPRKCDILRDRRAAAYDAPPRYRGRAGLASPAVSPVAYAGGADA